MQNGCRDRREVGFLLESEAEDLAPLQHRGLDGPGGLQDQEPTVLLRRQRCRHGRLEARRDDAVGHHPAQQVG